MKLPLSPLVSGAVLLFGASALAQVGPDITVLRVAGTSNDIAEYGTRLIRFRDGRVVADQNITHRRNAADELAALPPPEPDLIPPPADAEEAHS